MTSSEYESLIEKAKIIAKLDITNLFATIKEKAIEWKRRCNGG